MDRVYKYNLFLTQSIWYNVKNQNIMFLYIRDFKRPLNSKISILNKIYIWGCEPNLITNWALGKSLLNEWKCNETDWKKQKQK